MRVEGGAASDERFILCLARLGECLTRCSRADDMVGEVCCYLVFVCCERDIGWDAHRMVRFVKRGC